MEFSRCASIPTLLFSSDTFEAFLPLFHLECLRLLVPSHASWQPEKKITDFTRFLSGDTCVRVNAILQVGERFSQPPVEDVHYAKTRSMLNNLGLQGYEKNFKKGLLSDSTLPLLTDRHVN